MKIDELLKIIDIDETICIQDIYGNVLIINTNKYIPHVFDERNVIKFYSEKYRSIGTTGITLVIGIE